MMSFGEFKRENAIFYIKALRTMCLFEDAYGDPVDSDVYDDAIKTADKDLKKLYKIEKLFKKYKVAEAKKMNLTSCFENELCEVMKNE